MTKRSIQLGLLVLLKQVFCCTKFLESFLNILKYSACCRGGRYQPNKSHLVFLKLISMKIPSMLSGRIFFVNSLQGMSSLT